MHFAKRRRLQAETCKSRGETWLDRLPQEVCHRVALHVCRGVQNCNALALAQTSTMQRTAVLNVLNHRLTIHDRHSVEWFVYRFAEGREWIWDAASLRAWIGLMGDEVVELAQPLLVNLVKASPPGLIAPVICLPNLRVATIADHPSQIQAMGKSSSLQEVTLELEHRMPAKKVFKSLSKLPLKKLKIECTRTHTGAYVCPFQDTDVIGADQQGLAKYLPWLESIHVDCRCYWRDEHHASGVSGFWRALAGLRDVKEVALGGKLPIGKLPEEAFRYLSSREIVRLIDCVDAGKVAARVGTPIRQISDRHVFTNESFTRAEFWSLRNYPRLAVIGVKIGEGMEELLPEIVAQLPELKTLDLCWVTQGRREREICKYRGLGFAAALPGVMLRSVQAAPKLSTVCIMTVRIGLSELLEILECTGSRLRVFKTSLADQEEAPFERMEALVVGLTRYNNELRVFRLSYLKHRRGPTSRETWVEQGRRVVRRLGFLRTRVAHVDVGSMEAEVQDLVSGCELEDGE